MFFITAIISTESLIRNAESQPHLKYMRTRTFGYYPKLILAEDAVRENHGGLNECLYSFIVIEEIKPGVHAEAIDWCWYRWKHPQWVTCTKPDEFKQITNWALG